MSYLSALRSDVESPFDVAGSDDVVGLEHRLATSLLQPCSGLDARGGVMRPDAGVLEPRGDFAGR